MVIEKRSELGKRTKNAKTGCPGHTTSSVTLFNKPGWVPFYTEVCSNRCVPGYKRVNDLTPSYPNLLLIFSDLLPILLSYVNLIFYVILLY